MYKTISFRIKGLSPLLMHSASLADPRNEIVREMKRITAKGKKKTDDDLLRLSELEFKGGLYMAEKGPCVPGSNIEAMVIEAARKQRKGKDALCSILVDDMPLLIYDGPKDADSLWNDPRFVDVRSARVPSSKSTVMRTRARFNVWALEFEVHFLPEVMNRETVIECMHTAGQLIGLLDYRPKFGRFAVESAA